MSKRLFAALLAGTVSVSTAALAQGVTFEAIDANQDGAVSFEELTAAIPDFSKEAFEEADANEDGSLDSDEFEAIQN